MDASPMVIRLSKKQLSTPLPHQHSTEWLHLIPPPPQSWKQYHNCRSSKAQFKLNWYVSRSFKFALCMQREINLRSGEWANHGNNAPGGSDAGEVIFCHVVLRQLVCSRSMYLSSFVPFCWMKHLSAAHGGTRIWILKIHTVVYIFLSNSD